MLTTTIILIISGIIIFYSIIFLFDNYHYKGDNKAYIKFLSCRNVNYEGFHRYKTIELLKSYFWKYELFYFFNWVVMNVVNGRLK